MEKTVQKKKRSVLPLYLAALIWPLSLLFPARSLVTFVLRTAVLSALVLIVGKLIWKNQVVEEPAPETPKEAPETPKSTGNPAIDRMMQDRDRAISEMRRLNASILDPTLTRQIDEMEEVTSKIFDHVLEHPEKLSKIRKFMNYYLPTTLKLLNAYDRMGAQGVSGENIDGAMGKVEGIMETILQAFRRQLDELFGAEAMDIATDITVLETMMIREGLIDQPIQMDADAVHGEDVPEASASEPVELILEQPVPEETKNA